MSFNIFFQRRFCIILSSKPLEASIILISRSQPHSSLEAGNFGGSKAGAQVTPRRTFAEVRSGGYFPPSPPPIRPTRAPPGVAESGAFKKGAEPK